LTEINEHIGEAVMIVQISLRQDLNPNKSLCHLGLLNYLQYIIL